jgi:glycosyltransferase involved in cell wall biosynthesis
MGIDLTVITVVKNGASSVAQAIQSVIEQDAYNIASVEYLIIDGNSTDNTVEICKSFGLSVHTQIGTGIYDAMNYGIKISQGKFILFLNSDDVLITNAIKNIIHFIRSDVNIHFHIFPINMISNSGKVSFWDPHHTCNRRYSMPIPHPGCVMSSSMLNRLNGFNQRYKASSDFDLVLRAMVLESYAIHDDPIISFSPGGASSNFIACIENLHIRHANKTGLMNQIIGFAYDLFRFMRHNI